MAEPKSAQELWAETVPIIKDRVNHRSLWETMEKTVGLAIDGDTLILGINARFYNQAGHLNVSEHRNAIETTLGRLTGSPMKIRVIEGDTLDDWVTTQKRDARVAVMREATYEKRDKESAEAQSWDTLTDHIGRAYSSTTMRSLPQNKARFFVEMLNLVADAMEKLYPSHPDETADRHLARVIEKLAHTADLSPTVVALELDRLRKSR